MRHYGSDRLPIDFDISPERRQLDEAPLGSRARGRAGVLDLSVQPVHGPMSLFAGTLHARGIGDRRSLIVSASPAPATKITLGMITDPRVIAQFPPTGADHRA